MTTLCLKNCRPILFIFAITFFIREPICIIFGSNMPEEICNKTYIVFPTSPNVNAYNSYKINTLNTLIYMYVHTYE